MTSEVYAGVRDILAAPDWEPVAVTDHGQFFTISGFFHGMAHTGSRKDWDSLARDLDRIAREQFSALMEKAEPAPVIDPEPVVVEPAPEPQPDPRDAELEAMRAKIEALEAANQELAADKQELADANATLKGVLSDVEERITTFEKQEASKLPAPDERMSSHSETWEDVPDELKAAREGLESLGQAKARLVPKLNDELGRLKNMQALLGGAMPDDEAARQVEVERLLGILARVGEA